MPKGASEGINNRIKLNEFVAPNPLISDNRNDEMEYERGMK